MSIGGSSINVLGLSFTLPPLSSGSSKNRLSVSPSKTTPATAIVPQQNNTSTNNTEQKRPSLATRLSWMAHTGNNGSLPRALSTPNLQQIEHQEVVRYMEWANDFITMMPVPICLIDKKGFVHHTNPEFKKLIEIPYDTVRCPYVGRFFISDTFRGTLEDVSTSAVPLIIPMKVTWLHASVVTIDANEMYEWTMSGCTDKKAVIITGRLKGGQHNHSQQSDQTQKQQETQRSIGGLILDQYENNPGSPVTTDTLPMEPT